MFHQTENEDSCLLQASAPPTTNGHDTLRTTPDKLVTKITFKIAAAMICFSTLGLFNSLIFFAGPVGYVLSAQCSDNVHDRYGQRGIAVIGSIFQIVSTMTVASHPSFSMVLFAFAFQGVGAGLLDGSWCAWAGSMDNSNTISGFLHGSYSLGGAAGPFFINAVTSRSKPWHIWYSVLAGASILSFIVLVSAFQHEDAAAYRKSKQPKPTEIKPGHRNVYGYPATWLCAVFLITYVGTETAISGWIVSFMLRRRHTTPYISGLISSGYWIGMVIGRITLGFATDKMGVRYATTLYFLFALVIEILFALFSSAIVSLVLITSLGFVMGPMFPSAIVMLTRLLPGTLHVAAVSLVASLGQIGGAFLPFMIGGVIQGLGIGVFRFAILIQTILALLVWVGFVRLRPLKPSMTITTAQDQRRCLMN